MLRDLIDSYAHQHYLDIEFVGVFGLGLNKRQDSTRDSSNG